MMSIASAPVTSGVGNGVGNGLSAREAVADDSGDVMDLADSNV